MVWTDTPGRYRVKRGDSLWKIALKAYGSGNAWVRIATENRIHPPYRIFVGQILNMAIAAPPVRKEAAPSVGIPGLADAAADVNAIAVRTPKIEFRPLRYPIFVSPQVTATMLLTGATFLKRGEDPDLTISHDAAVEYSREARTMFKDVATVMKAKYDPKTREIELACGYTSSGGTFTFSPNLPPTLLGGVIKFTYETKEIECTIPRSRATFSMKVSFEVEVKNDQRPDDLSAVPVAVAKWVSAHGMVTLIALATAVIAVDVATDGLAAGATSVAFLRAAQTLGVALPVMMH